MEYFDVLNEQGQKTGEIVERSEAHRKGICHRVVQVWIVNSQNELLLQKRSKTKDWMPDMWHVSMGGHMESGEDGLAAIVREFEEELQFDIRAHIDELKFLHTFKEVSVTQNGAFIDNEFYDVYLFKCDVDLGALKLQEDEVQAVRYMKYGDFRRAIMDRRPDFVYHEVGHPLLLQCLDAYMGQNE